MSKFFNYIVALFALLFCLSCSYFQTKEKKEVLARVNQTFLYKEDLVQFLPKDITSEDSALYVTNYIKNWATEQLLLDQAIINLPNSKLQEFDKLVKDYRTELYTESYKDLILSKKIDTLIKEETLVNYFEENRKNFKLNDDLVKYRYIYLNAKFPKLDVIKKQFIRFNKEDRKKLERQSLKFKSYSFNDSIWVSERNFYQKLEILDQENSEEFLKDNNFLQQADSLGVYLIKIEKVLFRNENAPFEYAKPTVKQILLNRRKIKLTKDFEKEITKDALKNNKFEIYN
ncbi:peptidyl-prolyl cis-trans isomerase [Mesonia aestuariivivens]|uniref:Peptidyl-prolyl cis-trans isomerase n=1 Tax=Mesonia aestuariivivens TaxID=2796128 RepID=A0ABS6W1T5_9FLAO|nr:peptidyl-prolyl cis-trans isomerase [Mesonia aestuariivivens]MBW2961714.1 peptidyl-prolyl cis-trans isomerase [Mesonia aestuariivivens]